MLGDVHSTIVRKAYKNKKWIDSLSFDPTREDLSTASPSEQSCLSGKNEPIDRPASFESPDRSGFTKKKQALRRESESYDLKQVCSAPSKASTREGTPIEAPLELASGFAVKVDSEVVFGLPSISIDPPKEHFLLAKFAFAPTTLQLQPPEPA